MTRSRVRTRVDMRKVLEAARGPGADPRTWVSLARVDTDEDAIRWDDALGWIVDVTCVGGQLDGEGPIACRVAGETVGNGDGASAPVEPGVLVVILLPEGDANAGPIVVGKLWTPEILPPSEVAGELVNEDFSKTTWWVSVDRDVVLESRSEYVRVLGTSVRLADHDAEQSYIRGEDYSDAEADYLDAADQAMQQIAAAFAAMLPPGPPTTPVTAANVTAAINIINPAYAQFSIAVADFKAARAQYLSSRIKGA